MQNNVFSKLYKKIRLLKNKGKEPYLSIYKITGFYPDNIQFYQEAFLHRSSSVEVQNGRWINNERLEFLGDAVLSAIVADILYKHFDHGGEGLLTNTRSKIVSRESMNEIAKNLNLHEMLHYSIHYSIIEGHNSNILGNALEALIGAIYLDKGFDHCYQFINNVMIKNINLDSLLKKEVNFKSHLIEWSQKHRIPIRFDVIENFLDEQGSPVFQSAAYLSDTEEQIGVGIGFSKKESQQKAAEMAIKKIRSDKTFMGHIREIKRKRKQPDTFVVESPAETPSSEAAASEPPQLIPEAPFAVAEITEIK
ncbi:MAG TPA: ribonuclease III [Parabacteroides sp.]|nr:ribonuclease III [Parabacteroides sp.]